MCDIISAFQGEGGGGLKGGGGGGASSITFDKSSPESEIRKSGRKWEKAEGERG